MSVRNGLGSTALHLATWKGHTEIARLLIESGADIYAKNNAGYTPLSLAMDGGHTKIIQLLKEYGLKEEEVIASFKLTESQALKLVTNACNYIRKKATFTISTKCDFSILDLKTVGDGYNKIAKITIYSKGFWYDITFTVIYALTYDSDGEFISKLLEVRKGRFTGLGGLAQEFLRKDSDPIKKMTDAISKSNRENGRTPSSSPTRGSLGITFDGQWFFGYIKSLKVEIRGRSTYSSYTESSTTHRVFFAYVPYDTYDITITAYERSGQSGKAHRLKATASHKCSTTNIRISAGGGFIDPSIYVDCN